MRPMNACTLLVAQVDGCEVITIEDIAEDDGTLHPVQQALVEEHATQCGFCTPGMAMSLFALYHATDDDIGDDEARAAPSRAISAVAPAIARSSTPESAPVTSAGRHATRRHVSDDKGACGAQRQRRHQDRRRGSFLAAPATLDGAMSLVAERPDAAFLGGGTFSRSDGHPRAPRRSSWRASPSCAASTMPRPYLRSAPR